MEPSTLVGLILVVVLVLANGFFVATEFAIVAVRRSRLEQLVAEGHPTARAAQEVERHLDTYIAACQLGITMASLALGWLGEPAFAHLVEPPLEALIGSFAPAAAHGVAIGVAFAIITTLHIVIGELAPKGLALQAPEGTTLWVARPLQVFHLIFQWPIALLNSVGNGVLRLFGLRPASGHEMVHSVEELRLLVTGSREAGVVEASEARIASRAFAFGELTAAELMTPRTELDAAPLTASLAELRDRFVRSTHTRLPVYGRTIDDLLGFVHLRDLVMALERPPEAFDLGAMQRPMLAVPGSKQADDLLEEMRAGRRQMAVVIDEFGGTAGVVTLEDLVEALIGEIEDELLEDGEQLPLLDHAPEADGSVLVSGLMRLGEWEDLTGRRLSESDHEDADTVGGLVMAHLGRMPEEGDEVEAAGLTLRVERLDGRRVDLVRIKDLGTVDEAGA